MRYRSVPVVGVLVLLAGCATSPDPAQGGFISGVNGLLSGGYDQRVRAQSAQLTQMQIQQAAAEDEARRTNLALADREHRLATLRTQVAALDRSLKASRAAAERQRARNNDLSVSDRNLTSELDAANARLRNLQDQLRSDTSGADYEHEKQQYLSLQATIEALSEQLHEAQ
jgi:chromosome segregation ATPase